MSDSLRQALANKRPSLAMAVKEEILPKIKVLPEAPSKPISSRQLSLNEKTLKATQAKEKYIAAQAAADNAENKLKRECRLYNAIQSVLNLTHSLSAAALVFEVDKTSLSRLILLAHFITCIGVSKHLTINLGYMFGLLILSFLLQGYWSL